MNKFELKIEFNSDIKHVQRIAEEAFEHLCKIMNLVGAENVMPTLTILDGTFGEREEQK